MCQDVYQRLALHLSVLGMGMPTRDDLLVILRENLSPEEAEIALLLPTRVAPLELTGLSRLMQDSLYAKEELEKILASLSDRGLILSGQTDSGEIGYALHQVGFGFPQTFFWQGPDNPRAQKMAGLAGKYFNREVTREAFGGSETKPYRYIPPAGAIAPDQAVYPYHMMESVINKAKTFAVTNCACRIPFKMKGGKCDHPDEVCLKYDDMAQFVIDKGFGREISREEALDILKMSEEAGLVHFVDNTIEGVKHTCNCCGCACWNVGNIKRRKIPRDAIMATYFMRETYNAICGRCGICVDVCPVNALKIDEEYPELDEDWCIGCGVCITKCPTGAAKLRLRTDVEKVPADSFKELYDKIMQEKGLK